ncbi:MAG: sulfatase [Acidobacteriota bacterium]
MTKKLNVIMMTIDSLRADHLGAYGYHRDTSPRMDALAEEGALVEDFVCPGIPTHVSYTTMYTGQHPVTHGIVAHAGRNVLSRQAPFLSEILVDEGYNTVAFDNLLRARAWFGRGYEFYIDSSLRRPLVVNITCEEINKRAIEWLRMYRDEQPFFMFFHYWDPHYPFVPPDKYRNLFYEGDNPADPSDHSLDQWYKAPFGSIARDTWLRTPKGVVRDPAYVEALYDQEIRHMDDGIAQILGALDEFGLSDNTLTILVADHGESMDEHNIFYEHHGLYESVLRVPFMARLPGRIPKGLRLPVTRQHFDIAPTILEAVGTRVPPEMDGRSFWKQLCGEEEASGYDTVVSLECSWQAKWSLRTKPHKFILSREQDIYGTPMRELYDYVEDPKEVNNLVDEKPELAASMEAELEAWIADRLRQLGRTTDPVVEHGVSLVADGNPLLQGIF